MNLKKNNVDSGVYRNRFPFAPAQEEDSSLIWFVACGVLPGTVYTIVRMSPPDGRTRVCDAWLVFHTQAPGHIRLTSHMKLVRLPQGSTLWM